jgi:homoserine O-acetyltransferase
LPTERSRSPHAAPEAQDRGELHVQQVPRFELESGHVLEGIRHAYRLDGKLGEQRDNVVIVFHSLSAAPDPAGNWWSDVVGAGRAVDTQRYAVLSPSLLGSSSGTTSPADLAPQPFPAITIRDMVRLVHGLVEELGIRRIRLATGGSMGGMVALEWAAIYPALTDATVAFAAPARLGADALGWNHIQRRAIEVAGMEGMRLARMVGTMLYRTPAEFEQRFGHDQAADGTPEVGSYLEHQADKLSERFDPESYCTLLRAIAAHDVGRDRGGVGAALRAVRGRIVGVGIPGDRLYPAEEVRAWTHQGAVEYREIRSVHGHDAFLLETDRVGQILADALR